MWMEFLTPLEFKQRADTGTRGTILFDVRDLQGAEMTLLSCEIQDLQDPTTTCLSRIQDPQDRAKTFISEIQDP